MKIVTIIALFFLICRPAFAFLQGDAVNTFQAAPGKQVTGSISLSNDNGDPLEIVLKRFDYNVTVDGETLLLRPGSLPRSNASWLTLSNNRVVVPPHQKTAVPYTISIPQDSNLKGSYWSVILIEPLKASGSLEVYTYHVVTNVGEGTTKLNLPRKEVLPTAKGAQLVVDVANDGQVLLNPMLVVEIYDSKERKVFSKQTYQQKLLPNTAVRYFVDVSSVPAGVYQASLILNGRNTTLHQEHMRLTLPATR